MRYYKQIAITPPFPRILAWTCVFVSAVFAPKGLSSFLGVMALHMMRESHHVDSVANQNLVPSVDRRLGDPIVSKWLTYAVSKNKTLQALNLPQNVVSEVVQMFESGVGVHERMSDPNLDLYLVKATQLGLFSSHEQCLDAWQRLTWMQQFSPLQPMHAQLESTKLILRNGPVFYSTREALSLVDAGVNRLKLFGVFPTISQIEKSKMAVMRLAQGQCFGLPVPDNRASHTDMQKMVETLQCVHPFFFSSEKVGLWMSPSASLQTCLMLLISDQPAWRPMPVLGKISDRTSIQMHREGMHPCNVHSSHVSSNPIYVHEAMVGPFLGLMHDEYHVVTSCLLPANFRAFLFDSLIPYLDKISSCYPKTIREMIEVSCHELSHFVLNMPSQRALELRPYRAFEDFVKAKLWPYTEDNDTSCRVGYVDSYYVELNLWLKSQAPEMMLPRNRHRFPEVMSFLDWCVVAGDQSAPLEGALFDQGKHHLKAIADYVSYDGLPPYLQELCSRFCLV